MNFAGILLASALCGYWFLTNAYQWKFAIRRESGCHLFFKSSIAGAILLAAAWPLAAFLCHRLPEVAMMGTAYSLFEYPGLIIPISLSALLAYVLPYLLNLFRDPHEETKKAAKDNGDLIELVIQDSKDRHVLVELTMRGGKSYIGFAINSGITVHNEPDMALIPFASGYRKDDTRELVVTKYYSSAISRAISEFGGDLTYEDFQVALPISEIISARPFHIGAYKLFGNDMLD